MSEVKGWVIGEYTGDPFKDRKMTFGSALCGGSVATVTVDGAVDMALGVGTTDASSLVRVPTTAAEFAAGTVKFESDNATEMVHYLIIHKGLK